MEEFIAKVVSNIGVPAAICFYTLFGVNKTLKDLTSAINQLTLDVQKIEKLENQTRELNYEFKKLQTEFHLKFPQGSVSHDLSRQ